MSPDLVETDRKYFAYMTSAFYLTNSTLLVIKEKASLQSFWIASACIYGICYLFVVWRTLNLIALFQAEAAKLDAPSTGAVTPATEVIVDNAEEATGQEQALDLNPIVIMGLSPFDRYYRWVLSCARSLQRWLSVLCFRSEQFYNHLYPPASLNIKNKTLYQFYLRRDMYIAFLVLVLINCLTELWAHSVERPGLDSDFSSIIMIYEITNLITVIYIMYGFCCSAFLIVIGTFVFK